LGNEDSFSTAVLELRLSQSGALSLQFNRKKWSERYAGVIRKTAGSELEPLFKISSRSTKEEADEIFDL